MNIYLSAFLVFQLYGRISSQNFIVIENGGNEKNNINYKLKYMDVLMEDLLNQHWEKKESICLNKLLNIINNVKNSTLWAVWIWDSMQTPAGLLYGSQYSLGNYDQCMNSPWIETHPEFRTQYCLADIKLSETEPKNTIGDPYRSVKYHMNSVTKNRLKFHKITWGVCIPAECKTESTSKFVRTMLKYTHLGPENHSINVDHCQVAGATTEFSWGVYFFGTVIISFVIITVACTIINSTKTSSNDTYENKLLKAFCLTTNTSSLNKLSKNDIKVLHGLRALTSLMVVCVHIVFLQQVIGFGNSLTLDKDIDRLKPLLRGDYTVDIFLMMSGLLRIKSYMAIGNINPFKAILKRYLRYVLTCGVIILFKSELSNHIGDGPIWNLRTGEESRDCKNNWLISLLMLGNYVNSENICYGVLWTVPCDFHLSVIATILYWLFQKNKKVAITNYGILTTAALILPGVVTYQQNLPKIAELDFTITGNYKKVIAAGTYMQSHLRGGPYFIGMALGFFISTYKPDRHRNIFSKPTSSIATIFALTIATLNCVATSVLDKPNSNELFSFIVSSIHRSIFTLAICCIIVICEYGHIPLLRSVLTWHAFIPISKISFGIYLVHCLIYERMLNTTRYPLHYDALLMIIQSLPLISLSCLFGMLLYLFVEAPTNKITDIMIDIKADTAKKPTSETTSEIKNGETHITDIKKKYLVELYYICVYSSHRSSTQIKYTHLGPENHRINVNHCQVAGATTEFSWGVYFFGTVIISFVIITVACTIINSTKTSSNDTYDNKLLKAFCLTTNTSSLNKLSKNDIKVLHGLRALTSLMVVCVHIVFLQQVIGFGNSLTLDKDIDRLKPLLRGDYTVDIFLMMSGLLRIKSYMAIGNINPFKAILKRYLRYVLTCGVIILFKSELSNHIGDGPIWNLRTGEESRDCKNNWLISLLMLGNYVNSENICYGVLWTVPCDFHLSVIATILYWLLKKNKKAAFTIYGILMTAALILPGVVTYQQNLPKIAELDFTITGNYKKVIAAGTYMQSHLRGGPYFIGMALGYFMSTYKPDRHRNIFSKPTSSIATIFALTIATLNCVATSVLDKPNSNELFSFIVSSIHRSIFTLAICCIIVICEYGHIPLLRSVLTWHAFIPISKISFGIYLVHCLIYERMLNTTRSPLHYDAFLMIIQSLPLISLSCLFGMLLYLFVEAPTNKITDIMIDIKADTAKKPTSETTSEIKNGETHITDIKKKL